MSFYISENSLLKQLNIFSKASISWTLCKLKLIFYYTFVFSSLGPITTSSIWLSSQLSSKIGSVKKHKCLSKEISNNKRSICTFTHNFFSFLLVEVNITFKNNVLVVIKTIIYIHLYFHCVWFDVNSSYPFFNEHRSFRKIINIYTQRVNQKSVAYFFFFYS